MKLTKSAAVSHLTALAKYIYRHFGWPGEPRIYRLRRATDDYGLFIEPHSFFIRTDFSPRFVRGILVHELAHKICRYHTKRFQRAMRRISKALRRYED